MSSSSEETVVKKRAPRKKAGAPSTAKKKTTSKKRETGQEKNVKKRSSRKTTKKISVVPELILTENEIPEKSDLETEYVIVSRKAPTVLPQHNFAQRKHTIIASFIVAFSFALMAGGVWIGTSDPGVIDVEQLVREHNERVASGEIEGRPVTSITVPVQQRPVLRPANTPVTTEASETMIADDLQVDDISNEDTASNSDSTLEEVIDLEDEGDIPVANIREDTSYFELRHLVHRQPFGLI